MYCSNCGKEIPISSKFCQYCGNQVDRLEEKNTSNKNKNKSTSVKYEKKSFVWKFPQGTEPVPLTNSITMSEIRKRYWEEYKEEIESELESYFNKGWEPIKKVNSSRIELKKIEHTTRGPLDLSDILIIIVTFGLYLLIHLLSRPMTFQYSKPIRFTLPMKRMAN